MSEQRSWAREAEEYLLRLKSESLEKWLDPLRQILGQWNEVESYMRDQPRDLCVLPRMWGMEGSFPDRYVMAERTFDSVEGFMDFLKTSPAESNTSRIILMISKHEKTKGLIPKTPLAKFDWCVSVITLALLGSRWRIDPKILFPLNECWDEFWYDNSETWPVVLEKDQTVNSMDSLRLPSKRRVVDIDSTNEDRIVTETLYLATTIAPPQLDENFVNAFKSHYYPPDYHFLRLIRVSQAMNSGQTIDKYVVLCDSQELRGALRDFVMSRSFFDDGSPNEPEAILRGDFSILLVRYFKQYVIHQLCHNLDRLKTNLEEAKYEGRKDPSYNKLNYVLHLGDHLEMTECFLSYLARQCPTLPDFSKLNQTDSWPATFKSDQEYLRAAIESLEKELRQVHETIKMQIESKNGSRNTLFAILASFYLPFSLATGVLGMNIKEINGGRPKWSALVALGLPLAVVTVALPLGFGYGYRKSREFAAQNPRLFRGLKWAILFLGIVAVIIVVVVVVVVSMADK